MTSFEQLISAYGPPSNPVAASGGTSRSGVEMAKSAVAINGAFERLLVTISNTEMALSRLTVGIAQRLADIDSFGPVDRFSDASASRSDLDPVALERERLETIERTNRAYAASTDQVDALAEAHKDAEDKVAKEWDGFGGKLATTFKTLFEQIERDGKVSVSGVFDAVEPLVADFFSALSGTDMSSFVGQVGRLIGGVESGRGVGLNQIFSVGSSLLSGFFPGGAGSGAQAENQGGFSEIISSIAGIFGNSGGTASGAAGSGGSTVANVASTAIGAGSSFFGAAAGGAGSTAGTALAGANPYIAAAMMAIEILGPMLFERTPSVGPTTISRLLFPEGRGSQVGSADNGGDPDALSNLTDEIFDAVDDVRVRYGAGYRNFGLDIGYFSSPESGSGRESGYTLSTILNGVLGQDENIQGLTEPEVIEKAVFLALKQGLQDFDSPEVAEAAKNSTAEDLDELLEDLDFADAFGRLRQEFQDTGESIDAMTLALARQRLEAEKTGRELAGERFGEIFDGLDRIFKLFNPNGDITDESGQVDPVDVALGASLMTVEQERGRISGLPQDFVLVEDPADEGKFNGLGGFRIGEAEYSTRSNASLGRDGKFEVLDPEGEVLGAVDSLVEAINLVGEALTDGTISSIESVVSLDTPVGDQRFETEDAATAYQENIDRILDGIDIAQADVETFIGTLTGAFEPEQLGEFEKRLLEGQAALAEFEDQMPALTDRLQELKEQFPELADAVDAFVAQSTASLDAASADLQQAVINDFEEGVAADIRAGNGLGIVDSVGGLVESIDTRRQDGIAIGADVSGLDELFSQQLETMLQSGNLTIAAMEELKITFADNEAVMDVLNDTLSVGTTAANDNAAAQMTLAQITALATQELGEQIREQEELANASGRVVEQIGEARRRIMSGELSILSPADQLEQARLRFEDLSNLAQSGDLEAQAELSDASVEYLELARSFYASSEDYARIFEQVDGALESTESIAESQLRVAEEQLETLRDISRSLSGDLGDLPNPDAEFGANPTRNRLIARITGYAGDFGSGGFGTFRSGLSSETNALVDTLANTIGFADGGIMTAFGPLALKAYDQGGIAYGPQLTLFGEGRTPEAFVPLPDGRTIPVTVTQPANDQGAADSGLSERQARGIEMLVDETKRLRSEVSDMRAENATLRRTLERTVAGSRVSGRVA
jgi:hypothetical protein